MSSAPSAWFFVFMSRRLLLFLSVSAMRTSVSAGDLNSTQ